MNDNWYFLFVKYGTEMCIYQARNSYTIIKAIGRFFSGCICWAFGGAWIEIKPIINNKKWGHFHYFDTRFFVKTQHSIVTPHWTPLPPSLCLRQSNSNSTEKLASIGQEQHNCQLAKANGRTRSHRSASPRNQSK